MTNFIAGIMAAIIIWTGTWITSNPPVSATRYTISDPFSGKIMSEWRTIRYLDGTEVTEKIGP